MDHDQLRARARELLAARDRARRGQLFRPDRGVQADDVFVNGVAALAEEHAIGKLATARKSEWDTGRLSGELEAAERKIIELGRELTEAKAGQPQPDREQIATVLEQVAEHSTGADVREHVRQVILALRGDGLIFVNGPGAQPPASGATPAPGRRAATRPAGGKAGAAGKRGAAPKGTGDAPAAP